MTPIVHVLGRIHQSKTTLSNLTCSIDCNADDSAITEDEIRIAIKDLRNNKASGIDEIINKYFYLICHLI
jgi:hypothetical protein